MNFTLIGEVEARDTNLARVRQQGEIMPYLIEFLDELAQVELSLNRIKETAKEEFKKYGINLIF